MGREWPDSYAQAESAIHTTAKGNAGVAHIDRAELNAMFADAGIYHGSFDDVAASLATLGVITQFSDCPDLSDFIVLRPQWLTKRYCQMLCSEKFFKRRIPAGFRLGRNGLRRRV
jgi:hypothetical protein